MCLQVAQLQRSHLLPKALYKTVRGDGANPHPLHIAPGNWHQSSYQEWVHLLCFDCEQRIHHGGEDWTLRHLLRKDGKFKLRDKIIANSQFLSSEDLTVFQVNANADVDFEKLAYFTASVIWKAAAYPWRGDGNEITLGSRYYEEFRRYLMGEGPFPENAALHIDITRPENQLKQVVAGPYNYRGPGYFVHKFMTPGVIFSLAVGTLLPDDRRRTCSLRHRMVSSHNHEETFRRTYKEMER